MPPYDRIRTRYIDDAFDLLRENPDQFVSRLLAGHLFIPPFGGFEPTDLMIELLKVAEEQRPILSNLLDTAVLHWLEAEVNKPLQTRSQEFAAIYVPSVIEAFRLARIVPLERTCQSIKFDLIKWFRWTLQLRLGHTHDPVVQLLWTAAKTQEDNGLWYFWNRICERSAQNLSWSYLPIAIAGLLGLPRSTKVIQESAPWSARPALYDAVVGLLLWSHALRIGSKENRDFFLDEWVTLSDNATQNGYNVREILFSTPQKLQDSYGFRWICEYESWRRPSRIRSIVAEEPTNEELNDLLRLLRWPRFPHEERRQRVEALVNRYVRYAASSQDTKSLLKALHRIGKVISGTDVALGFYLVRHALTWESNNPYAWDLWYRVLNGLGDNERAESVLWEMARRFPDGDGGAVARTRLAKLLYHSGRLQLATQVVHETWLQFSENPWMRHTLAHLLILSRRYEDAKEIVSSTKLSNEISANLWTRILLKQGKYKEARTFLQKCVRKFNYDSNTTILLARIFLAVRQYKEAYSLLLEAWEARTDPELGLELARMLERQGDEQSLREAISILDQIGPTKSTAELAAQVHMRLEPKLFESDGESVAIEPIIEGDNDKIITSLEGTLSNHNLTSIVNALESPAKISSGPSNESDNQGSLETSLADELEVDRALDEMLYRHASSADLLLDKPMGLTSESLIEFVPDAVNLLPSELPSESKDYLESARYVEYYANDIEANSNAYRISLAFSTHENRGHAISELQEIVDENPNYIYSRFILSREVNTHLQFEMQLENFQGIFPLRWLEAWNYNNIDLWNALRNDFFFYEDLIDISISLRNAFNLDEISVHELYQTITRGMERYTDRESAYNTIKGVFWPQRGWLSGDEFYKMLPGKLYAVRKLIANIVGSTADREIDLVGSEASEAA